MPSRPGSLGVRLFALLWAGAGFFAAVAGGAQADAAAGPPGTLHSVGADTMDELTFGWLRIFRRRFPDVDATIEARSSLSAAPALTSGLADVAPVAREFLPGEHDAFVQKFGYPPLLIRVAGGSYATPNRSHALAVYVHRDNPVRSLTMAQLDAVFSATRRRGAAREVATWGDLGATGEWAQRPVNLYSIRRPNGIANFFQQRVLLGGDYRVGIRERNGADDTAALGAVVESIAGDVAGIGFAGFAQARSEVRPLALAEEGDRFVEGSPATVRDHSYPLARWVYIAVNRRPGEPLPRNVRAFLEIVLSAEGQRVVEEEGAFLPLPPAILEAERARIR